MKVNIIIRYMPPYECRKLYDTFFVFRIVFLICFAYHISLCCCFRTLTTILCTISLYSKFVGLLLYKHPECATFVLSYNCFCVILVCNINVIVAGSELWKTTPSKPIQVFKVSELYFFLLYKLNIAFITT